MSISDDYEKGKDKPELKRSLLVYFDGLTERQFKRVRLVACELLGRDYLEGAYLDVEDLDETDNELIYGLKITLDEKWGDNMSRTQGQAVAAWNAAADRVAG